MPSHNNHLQQVQHNRNLLNSFDLDSTPYLDWVVTIAFYTALHNIEAWFAAQGRGMHFESHDRRQQEMGKVKDFKNVVWSRYRELEFQSRRSRYQCVQPSKTLVQTRILPYLNEIESEIQRLLGT